MDSLDEQIIQILKNSPDGIKARKIATMLNVERKSVNSRLYLRVKSS